MRLSVLKKIKRLICKIGLPCTSRAFFYLCETLNFSKKMKFHAKFLLLLAVLFAALQLIDAKSVKELIEQDPGAAAGIYYPYHSRGTNFTPAPRGFKPVYISHYGRHGSRYHTNKLYFERAVEMMGANQDILTPEGKEVYELMVTLLDEHQGMEGQLSELGAQEHQGIAKRMYRNFRRVFKKRNQVRCISSTSQRCIISMANFTSALKGCRPALNFSFVTGEKYMKYILPRIRYEEPVQWSRHIEDSLRTILNYEPLYEALFTDPAKAMDGGLSGADFARYVYAAGAISADLGHDDTIFRHYPASCLEDQTRIKTVSFYTEYANSTEWGDYARARGYELVQFIVDHADSALQKGSGIAADLRFGHDTGVVPLATALGLEECAIKVPALQSPDTTSVAWMTPMGTNLQIVFYQNRKGRTLVKILYNERETSIPALTAVSGPYYDWENLRSYLVSEIDNFLLFNGSHERVPEPADAQPKPIPGQPLPPKNS